MRSTEDDLDFPSSKFSRARTGRKPLFLIDSRILTVLSRKDQALLWCPLLAVILFLGLFIWWCRSDDSCCDVERPFLYRFGCKKRRPEDEETEYAKMTLWRGIERGGDNVSLCPFQ